MTKDQSIRLAVRRLVHNGAIETGRLDISAAVVQDEIRRIAQEIAAGSYRPPGDRNRKK